MHDLINRIKLIREQKNITIDEMAKLFAVHRNTISNYERGVREPSLNYIKFLYTKFYANLNFIFTGEGEVFLKRSEENSEESKVNPELLSQIIKIAAEDPELISYAIKAINGDKKAREKFIKLTE